MFVLLNGAFGIGKTTVARLLATSMPDAAVYDPERIGVVLHRLPGLLLGRRGRPDDFQDIPQWRRLIVHGARWRRRRAAVVIIPMAFSRSDYFAQLSDALARHDAVRKFCLTAPLGVVEARLAEREIKTGVNHWARRRAAECCDAHCDPAFGQPIDATPPADIVASTIRRLLAG